MVQERSRKILPSLRRAEEVLQDTEAKEEEQSQSDAARLLDSSREAVSRFDSESYCLIVVALRHMLETQPDCRNEADALMHQAVLLRRIPLSERRLPSPVEQSASKFLSSVTSYMAALLKLSDWQYVSIDDFQRLAFVGIC